MFVTVLFKHALSTRLLASPVAGRPLEQLAAALSLCFAPPKVQIQAFTIYVRVNGVTIRSRNAAGAVQAWAPACGATVCKAGSASLAHCDRQQQAASTPAAQAPRCLDPPELPPRQEQLRGWL